MEALGNELRNLSMVDTVDASTLVDLIEAMRVQDRSAISMSDLLGYIKYNRKVRTEAEEEKILSSSFASVSMSSGVTSAENNLSSSNNSFGTPNRTPTQLGQKVQSVSFTFGSKSLIILELYNFS